MNDDDDADDGKDAQDTLAITVNQFRLLNLCSSHHNSYAVATDYSDAVSVRDLSTEIHQHSLFLTQ